MNLDILIVCLTFAAVQVVAVVFYARTTWHAQRREAEAMARITGLVLAGDPNTAGLAYRAIDGETPRSPQPTRSAAPDFDSPESLVGG